MKHYLKFLLFLICIYSNLFSSQETTFDTTFNNVGYNLDSLSNLYDATSQSIGVQSNGNIIIAGQAINENQQTVIFIASMLPTGEFNINFGENGLVTTVLGTSAYATSVAIQSDDKIVITGTVTQANIAGTAIVIARYNTNGSLDTTFNGTGYLLNYQTSGQTNIGNQIQIQSDGKIVLVGNTSTNCFIERYTTNGAIDKSFGSGGYGYLIFENSSASSFIIQLPDNSYIMNVVNEGNNFSELQPLYIPHNGSFFTSFDAINNIETSQTSSNCILQINGKFIITGVASNDPTRIFAAQWHNNGTIDTSFGINGLATITVSGVTDLISSAVNLQENEEILITGSGIIDNQGSLIFAKFYVNGQPDTTFNQGLAYNIFQYDSANVIAYATALIIDPTTYNKLLVTGQIINNNSQSAITTQLIPSNNGEITEFDTTFNETGFNVSNTGEQFNGVCIQQSNDKILAAGYTDIYLYIERLNTNGTVDTTFGTDGNISTRLNFNSALINAITTDINGTIYITGQVTNNSNQYGMLTGSYANNGTGSFTEYSTTGFYSDITTEGNDLIFDSEGRLLVCGAFAGDQVIVFRYINGSLDNSFGGDGSTGFQEANCTVFNKALSLYSNNLGYNNIANAYYIAHDTSPYFHKTGIKGFTVNGTFDLNFNGGNPIYINLTGDTGDTIPADIITQPDNNLIVLGSYATTYNVAPYNLWLTRISSTGDIDTTFGPNGTGFADFAASLVSYNGFTATTLEPTTLNLQADGKLLVTGFATINNINYILALRYHQNGTLDYSFAPGGYTIQSTGSNNNIYDSCLQENQSLLTVGAQNDDSLICRFTNFIANDPTTIITTQPFAGPGSSPSYSNEIQLNSTEQIILAGQYQNNDTYNYMCAYQYNQDGTLNPNFGPNANGISQIVGNLAISGGKAVAVYPRGSGDLTDYIFIVGTRNPNYGNSYETIVGRYTDTGFFDTNFDGQGWTTYDPLSNTSNGGKAALVYTNGKSLSLHNDNNTIVVQRYLTNGTLDNSFNGDGIVIRHESSANLLGIDMAFYDDSANTQNIAVLYNAGTATAKIMSLTPDGSNNSNFNGGFVDIKYIDGADQTASENNGSAITVQPDGKLVVTGFYLLNSNTQPANIFVSRYTNTGQLDTTFGINGFVTLQLINSSNLISTDINCYEDGKILVTGYGTFDGISQFIAFRLNTDGSFDTTFSSTGYIIGNAGLNTYINSSIIQPNQQIAITGNVNEDIYTVLLNNQIPTFIQDSSFGNDGLAILDDTNLNSGQGNAIGQQSSGQFIVAGKFFDTSIEANVVTLRRYNTGGTVDLTFGIDGLITTILPNYANFNINQLAIYPPNTADVDKIVIVGQYNGNSQLIMQYLPNGSLDTSFNGSGMITTVGDGLFTALYDVQIGADNKIVVCGTSNSYPAIARYLNTGVFDTSFSVNGWQRFSTDPGNATNLILSSTQSTIPTYTIVCDRYTITPTYYINYVYINNSGLSYSSYNNGIYPPNNPPLNSVDFILTSAAQYLAAGNVDSSIFLARWNNNSSGSVDTTFGTNGYVQYAIPNASSTTVSSVQMNSNYILVTGTTTISDINYIVFIQFNNDGSQDIGFNNGLPYIIIDTVPGNSIIANNGLIQSDSKWVVAGQFNNIADTGDQGFFIGRFLGDYLASTSSTTNSTATINAYGTDPNTIQNFLPIPLYIANTIPASLISTIQATLDVAVTEYVQEYISYPQFNFITHLYLLGGYLRTAQLVLLTANPDYSQQINLLFYAIRYRINQLTPPSAPKLF